MLYECACGFTSVTATAFYRHLAQSKDEPGKHQLVHAKLVDTASANAAQSSEPQAAAPPQHAPMPASRIPSAPIEPQAPLPRPPSIKHKKAAPATSVEPTPLTPYPDIVELPVSTSLVDVISVGSMGSLQELRHRSTSSQRPLAGRAAGTAAADDSPEVSSKPSLLEPEPDDSPVMEINCHTPRSGPLPQATASTQAMQGLLVHASTAVGSLLMYGLNPLRLFGLSDTADTEQGPASTSAARGAVESAQGAHASPEDGDANAAARHVIASCNAVLLWRDPWRSFRVFAMFLYLGVCSHQLSSSSLPILPTTAVLAAALLYLSQNALRAALKPGGSPQPQGTSAQALTNGPSSTAQQHGSTQDTNDAQDLRLYHSVHSALDTTARLIVPTLAAGVVLVHRALSGRRLATTAITWAFLWFAMFMGELRLIGQLPFSILLYVAAFSVPALYVRSREGFDVLVEDAVRLLLRLLLRSSRVAVGGSALAALVVAVCTSAWSPVLRASAAAAAALAVLLWQARPTTLRQQ